MADVTDLIEYYTNLLIIQYAGLPKAAATIGLIAQTILIDGVVEDIQNAYDIDTAVGPQLDVVGKYQGVDRYFSEIDLMNFFAMVPYSDFPSSPPSSPPAFGFSTYATFSDYDYNGTLVYNEIITSRNALSDDNFRTLIRLAILRNYINFSDEAIDNGMWNLFAGTIRPEESSTNMTMLYFFSGQITTLIQAILAKGVLPKPMGVQLQAVTGITGNMFSYTLYDGYESPYGYGFSTYSNYGTLTGQMLTYDMISEY